jgi:hypothetical protein
MRLGDRSSRFLRPYVLALDAAPDGAGRILTRKTIKIRLLAEPDAKELSRFSATPAFPKKSPRGSPAGW